MASLPEGTVVVSGGAKGVDSWVEATALMLGLSVQKYLPDWEHEGRGAGFKRNWQIIHNCDRLVAFWNGTSKGTQHTIESAKSENKPLLIIHPENYLPATWTEPSDYAF